MWLVAGPTAAQTVFEGAGRVIALDGATGTITLDHGPIPDLMPRGRSEFPLQRADVLRDARIGDVVRFSLVASDATHGVLAISRLEPRPAPDAGPSRQGGGLLDVALGPVLASGVIALVLLGGAGCILWRGLRGLRRDLAAAAEAQGTLRRDVRTIRDTVEETVALLRDRYFADVRWRTAAIETLRSKSAGEAPMTRGVSEPLLVVRQGETELFRSWQEHPVTPGVQVIWDRRGAERRTRREEVLAERRRGDRRRPAPTTWTELGFVLAASASFPDRPGAGESQ